MHTAPGRVFEDLHLALRRVRLQKVTVVGKGNFGGRRDQVERICERHVAMRMMVAVGLSIGCNMHQLFPLAVVGEPRHQSTRQGFSPGQQLLESDCLRCRAVVKEQVD